MCYILRYHYEKPKHYTSMYGEIYECRHPVYRLCTLYRMGDRGLAVIQQRHDINTKITWWSDLDPWLTDDIYLHPKFKEYFDKRAGKPEMGLYPTVTVRQLMWALKMKPLPRERWETVFDRKEV